MKVEIRAEAAQFPFWEFLPAFAAPRKRGGMSQHLVGIGYIGQVKFNPVFPNDMHRSLSFQQNPRSGSPVAEPPPPPRRREGRYLLAPFYLYCGTLSINISLCW
jgi:hypothetical protein